MAFGKADSLSQCWYKEFDSGVFSLVIALDIAGAFACVWHRVQLAKLGQLRVNRDLLLSERHKSTVAIKGYTLLHTYSYLRKQTEDVRESIS